jgi:hypothetical protein
MEACCVEQVQVNSFLTSTLGGGEWSTSRPGHFTSKKVPRQPLNRRLRGPKSLSGGFGERKSLFFVGTRTPDRPAYSLVAISATQSRFLLLLLLLLLVKVRSPLCPFIFLRQTMSLRNTVLQLFCRYCLWCPYH